jgi:hypothetical protein
LFRYVVRLVEAKTVTEPRMRQVMEVAAKYLSAREVQLARVAEVQDRVAKAFARRSQDEVSAHLLAGLTLNALSVAYRVWFRDGKQDIEGATRKGLHNISALARS